MHLQFSYLRKGEPAEGAPAIHFLPGELLEQIYRLVDPSSHLNLALADKWIHTQSSYILDLHQECHKLFYPYTDWSAETLTHSLRSFAGNHLAAWHITWVKGLHPNEAYERNPIGEKQLRPLVNFVHGKMDEFGIPIFALNQMLKGDLEALQVALIALCPRLDTIETDRVFGSYRETRSRSERAQNLWEGSEMLQEYTPDPAYNLLGNYIKAILEAVPQPVWPPGLQSLRTVKIGAQSPRIVNANNVAPIFRLPNIKNVYLRGLWIEEPAHEVDDDRRSRRKLLADQSSSVEHLFFEDASPERVQDVMMDIVECAKLLKSFITKGCDFSEFDQMVAIVTDCHNSSLEVLVYGDENGLPNGFRTPMSMYYEVSTSATDQIRICMVDLVDIRLHSIQRVRWKKERISHNVGSAVDFKNSFDLAVPCPAEVVLVRCSEQLLYTRDADMIVDALKQTLSQVDRRPRLKTIYVDEVYDRIRLTWESHDCSATATNPCDPPCTDGKEWCKRMVECGAEFGIEVIVEPGATRQYFQSAALCRLASR